MVKIARVIAPALLVFASLSGQSKTETGKGLTWAYPVPDPNLPPASQDKTAKHLEGSTKSYTQEQIDDQFNPPDWFPDSHATPPSIILRGIKPGVQACGSCHLMSGLGHPESAYLSGLPVGYFERQMLDFKTGDRKDPAMHEASLRSARMNGIGKAISEKDVHESAQWFASLKPGAWYKVVEAKMVPKSIVNNTRMRLPHPSGGMEPIGNRIIVMPVDPERVELRDPRSGFTAYAPPGSIAKGKALVTTGASGKTIACDICHGEDLKGLGDVPGLAGQNPLYTVRQLFNIQSGARGGTSAALMKRVVAKLSEEEMLQISAYLSSLNP